jgi:hypothetical protein
MGVAARRYERRYPLEERIETVFGLRPGRPKGLHPPSLRFTFVVAAVIGLLEFFGTSSASASVAIATAWVVALLLVRWAWPLRNPPTWKLVAVALYAGPALSALEHFTTVFGPSISVGSALRDGSLLGIFVLCLGLGMRSMLSPRSRSVASFAFRVRDEALRLAGDGEAPRAPERLLEVCEGRRVPLEMARDLLSRRRDDSRAAWAVEQIDEAIDRGRWGWWPWSSTTGST